MLEITAQGLSPWAEQGCDSQSSLSCSFSVIPLATEQGRFFPKVPVFLLLTHT